MKRDPVGNEGSQPTPLRGVVMLDVDGVLFRGQLLISLARRRGLWPALRTSVDCLLFDMGRISLERLLSDAYRRLRGMPMEEVWAVYRAMPLTENAAATVRALKEQGLAVVLLTAGTPDPIVKHLAGRLCADDGAGMEAVVRDGRLTGEIAGALTRRDGKVLAAERWIARAGLTWEQVVAIGDDRNNLGLMRRAGKAIGFRPTYSVRREVAVLVESEDLAAVLPHALRREEEPAFLDAPRRPWYRELFRKTLHLTFGIVPLLAVSFPVATSLLVLCGMGLYLLSELWRINGANIPLVHWVGRHAIRRRERSALAAAPLTLALGALTALWLFPRPIGMACILTAAVADSAAAVIGSRWGRNFWPHNPRKTLLGSAAFLVSAFVCGTVYLPAAQALLLALIATVLESLPLEEWDNFVTPVGTGLVLASMRGMGIFG